jgi:hypothetical protein
MFVTELSLLVTVTFQIQREVILLRDEPTSDRQYIMNCDCNASGEKQHWSVSVIIAMGRNHKTAVDRAHGHGPLNRCRDTDLPRGWMSLVMVTQSYRCR